MLEIMAMIALVQKMAGPETRALAFPTFQAACLAGIIGFMISFLRAGKNVAALISGVAICAAMISTLLELYAQDLDSLMTLHVEYLFEVMLGFVLPLALPIYTLLRIYRLRKSECRH